MHYTLSPEIGLMGCKEKADEPGPKPAYDMSNTWSAMSLVGHIGSVPDPSVSLLTSKCILVTGRSGFAFSKLLTQNKCMQSLCKTTKCIKKACMMSTFFLNYYCETNKVFPEVSYDCFKCCS